jgi:hypothetical protein
MRRLAILVFTAAAFGQTKDVGPPLIVSDIPNFWSAYDASQPGSREEAFQKLYLDRASPGLRDFIKLRIGSAKRLAGAVDRQYPRFYASVRPYTLEVEKQAPVIARYLARYRELYPEAHFPPVYFVIGRLTSGGTTSDRGLLIGTEVNSLGPDVDSSEIDPSFRRAMGTAEHIPLIVVHELTHTQASEAQPGDLPELLRACLSEGAADFMTELVASSSINAYIKEWAEPRREELFRRFARDLETNPKGTSGWLFNYDNVKEEPADLGYWIGAEICRSYYAQAQDKRAAVREIVTQAHPETIVRGSGYAWLVKPAP